MRRRHLFEFGDQPWLPKSLRDGETAYLAVAYKYVSMPRVWAAKIATLFRPGETIEILDLCAGSGGAMPLIIRELETLGHPARATLTDLYPNPASISDPRMKWLTDPVDASHVPPELTGVRTMFSAFHHFRPAAATAILKDAFDRRRPICIFESGCGTWLGVAMMLLVPGNVLLMMALARPFRWSYLWWTYLVPVLPAIIFWDGVVSMQRVYSVDYMKKLTEDLQAPDYVWEIGDLKAPRIPGRLPYLIGRPV